ncbi:MAG: hypothetical protein GX442_12135 [Candidatus Riflebacteria bacterium]|nr:hypothetical protein [Candidatus Riflebacteria bacterium]
MTPPSSSSKEITPQDRALMKFAEEFLRAEGYRFHFLAEDCIEMYLQGKHLTMRMLIYAHNRHLVIRVPAFIRGAEMRRTDFLTELMRLMNEYFDIRFELSPDGQSLSGASNHIVEDGQITKAQFSQALMVVAYMVDENYPRLLKILYGQEAPVDPPGPAGRPGPAESPAADDLEETTDPDEIEEPAEEEPSGEDARKPKIN